MQLFRAYITITLVLCTLPWQATAMNPAEARRTMVARDIRGRGIHDLKVLAAMTSVPRHRFVPQAMQRRAYGDHPLPIGDGQTISQPYIVALMTTKLNLTGDEKVLEIGTGSGYQAAVLAHIVKTVYTIEIRANLHRKATRTLQTLKYTNIHTRHADGYFGWPQAGPFDCIMITAAVDHIPPPLKSQLKEGGRMILPQGNPFSYQNLVLVTKKSGDYFVEQIAGVLFVPMTGEALK